MLPQQGPPWHSSASHDSRSRHVKGGPTTSKVNYAKKSLLLRVTAEVEPIDPDWSGFEQQVDE
eukprot:8411517-Lingulodinium_polyedra.AAC.1